MAEAASSSSQPNAYQSILDKFGEIPKHLPEDVVGYSLYILTSPDSASTDIRSQLRNIDKEGKSLVDTLLAGYIWQRDPFSWQIEWDTS